MKTILSLLTVLLLLPGSAAAKPIDSKAVDAVVEEALKVWQVPGVAVVVIHGDDEYLKGYGVRELGSDRPVTADTLFAIGSCTKAFTATAIALLVDEGKMSWDDPVRKYVEYFHLSDPLADQNVTLRDLLCHRTGLARHDLLWYRAPWSIEETIRRIGSVELSHSFRSRYEYNNIMFLVAGQAVGSASKGSWQDFVQKRLFEPLEMKEAVFTSGAVQKAANHASPHLSGAGGKVEVIPWYNDDQQIRASGSIKASATDLSKWVRFHLNDGVVGGKRLVSHANLAETYTPQVVLRVSDGMAHEMGTTQQSYGLGWHIQDYRGQMLIDHGGAVDGFRAHITLVPKAKVAIVVLANLGNSDLPEALSYSLVDLVLGQPRKDWNGYYGELAKRAATLRARRDQAREAEQRKGTKPSRELGAYAGDYRDPAYGTATISVVKDRLQLRWSSFTVRLEHFHFDTFSALEEHPTESSRLQKELATFNLGADGDPAVLHFLGRDFKRVKPR